MKPTKQNIWLPLVLMVVFALSRWPGVLPQNFSAAYALAFCAGVYFPGWLAWLPLGALMATDVGLNVFYYHVPIVDGYFIAKNLAFLLLIVLGRSGFRRRDKWVKLVGGGLLGALIFYVITNVASWLFDPGYSKTLAGLIQALTSGLPGYPPTISFLLNTLLSGGLFTGLFAGAMKLESALEKQEQEETEEKPEEAPEPEPEEAKA